jgi:surface carbohydrate biosynthesis protein
MLKEIKVLWLVEHVARELDVACAVRDLIQTRHGVNITIRNIYLHANEVMSGMSPQVVVLPFFYRVSDLAIKDYVEAWPNAIFFNLACEEIHYKAQLLIKAPSDMFTRKRVIHHAWGDFYKDYLIKSGVPSENVHVNGNPVYQLYKLPYSAYFKQKSQLASDYGLDPSKRWVFIPENYKWAFFSDQKLRSSADRGGNLDENIAMRDFCRDSLRLLMQWCNDLGKGEKVEIIFRPRPATNSQHMEAFFRENVGGPSARLHFTKAETVREWIMASDIVISSISTSLIEAAIYGKPVYIVEPINIPDSLYCDWYDLVPRIRDSQEFERASMRPLNDNHGQLQSWAEREMLSRGDPIQGLADIIGLLLNGTGKSGTDLGNNTGSSAYRLMLQSLRMNVIQRFKRLLSQAGLAIKMLSSVIKLLAMYFVSIFSSRHVGSGTHTRQEISSKVFDRMKQFFSHFKQGLSNTDYYNSVTHEMDEFTDSEIHERTEKWHEVLVKT